VHGGYKATLNTLRLARSPMVAALGSLLGVEEEVAIEGGARVGQCGGQVQVAGGRDDIRLGARPM
jgi:hypothetical protein